MGHSYRGDPDRAHRSAVLRRDEATVSNGSGIVRIELQSDRTGVVVANIKRDVLNVIVKPVCGAESTAPHDAGWVFCVGKRAIFQAKDCAMSILPLKKILPQASRPSAFFFDQFRVFEIKYVPLGKYSIRCSPIVSESAF